MASITERSLQIQGEIQKFRENEFEILYKAQDLEKENFYQGNKVKNTAKAVAALVIGLIGYVAQVKYLILPVFYGTTAIVGAAQTQIQTVMARSLLFSTPATLAALVSSYLKGAARTEQGDIQVIRNLFSQNVAIFHSLKNSLSQVKAEISLLTRAKVFDNRLTELQGMLRELYRTVFVSEGVKSLLDERLC